MWWHPAPAGLHPMSDTLFLFFDRFEEVGWICWFGNRWQAPMLAEVRVATRAQQDIVSPSLMPVFRVWKKHVGFVLRESFWKRRLIQIKSIYRSHKRCNPFYFRNMKYTTIQKFKVGKILWFLKEVPYAQYFFFFFSFFFNLTGPKLVYFWKFSTRIKM